MNRLLSLTLCLVMLVQGAPYWTQQSRDILLNSLGYAMKPNIPYQYTLKNLAPLHPKQAQWWKRGTHRVYAPTEEQLKTVFA